MHSISRFGVRLATVLRLRPLSFSVEPYSRFASGIIIKYSAASSGWPSANSSSARLGRSQLAPVLPRNSVFPEHQVRCSWDPRHRAGAQDPFQIAAALAATISLAACVAPPAAPTIPVAPGPNKTLDRFGADQAACQQYAAAQISPAVAAANNQAVGGALLGTALGAGLGAGIGAAAGNAGKGAAIGAASGGAFGIIGNAGGAPFAQESLQQQYDVMYGQCMAAQGNSVANFSPPPGTTPYSGSPSPYSGGPPPYLSGPSSYPSPYSGDLPPYYRGPPPPAPGGAPYPGAPVPPPSY
jgi:hypothetical protein